MVDIKMLTLTHNHLVVFEILQYFPGLKIHNTVEFHILPWVNWKNKLSSHRQLSYLLTSAVILQTDTCVLNYIHVRNPNDVNGSTCV